MPGVLNRPSYAFSTDASSGEKFRDVLSRRQLVAGLGSGSLLLGGCRSSSETPEPASTSAVRTVEAANGRVEVPAEPRRIVSLSPYSTYGLLDLGIAPRAATMPGGRAVFEQRMHPDHRALAARVKEVRTEAGWKPLLESVASFEPDLIIAMSTKADENLSKYPGVAPTALFTGTTYNDWERACVEVATFVGRKEQLNALRRRLRKRQATVAAKHADVLRNRTWAVISGAYVADQASVMNGHTYTGKVLAGSGFTVYSGPDPDATDLQTLSLENLSALRTVDEIVVPTNPDGSVAPGTQKVLDHPLWEQLPAARAHHVHKLRAGDPAYLKQVIELVDELDHLLRGIAATAER